MIEEEDKTEQDQEESPEGAAEASDPDTPGSEAEDVSGGDSETPAEEPAAEEPAAEEVPAEEPEAESTDDSAAEADPDAPGSEAEEASGSDPDDDLPWKARRRLERSRQPAEAEPQRSPEERQSERSERRAADAVLRRRHRQSRRNRKGEPRTGTPVAEHQPNPVKVRQGIVVSNAADKTITVRIDIARRHPTYEKIVRRSRTLRAHDESNEAGQGDVVRVIETRPISKSKRWRLVEVVEKAR